MTNEPQDDDRTPPERGPRDRAADELYDLALAFAVAADVCREMANVVRTSTGVSREHAIYDAELRVTAVADQGHDTRRALNTERNRMRNERLTK